jgi:hypothetical protein
MQAGGTKPVHYHLVQLKMNANHRLKVEMNIIGMLFFS